MLKEVSKLLIYSDLGENSILENLAELLSDAEKENADISAVTKGIYREIKRLLDLATSYGFDRNLWQNYLTFLMIINENSFSLTCERAGVAEKGTVNNLVKNDFRVFKKLFHYDFSSVEEKLGINCFSLITDYTATPKRECVYNRSVSDKVKDLSVKIDAATDEEEVWKIITEHYKTHGVGLFGLNRAFRIEGSGENIKYIPINNADTIRLSDLVGYEYQKKLLVENTEMFVRGKKANNALLYGDSGTGKSTSIKAVLNEYFPEGLRMIEIYRHQFKDLSFVIKDIKNRNYRFIIYIDDLSFEDNETEYKFLKAVIEGGVETRPDNILIYATSNRRHLIKETWSDRNDMEFSGEIHRSDTVEEKLSLSARFGVLINYSAPDKKEFLRIVKTLAERENIDMPEEKLFSEANKWEMHHSGVSGRTARQFIDHLAGIQTNG